MSYASAQSQSGNIAYGADSASSPWLIGAVVIVLALIVFLVTRKS